MAVAEFAHAKVHFWLVSSEPWRYQNYHLVRRFNQVKCEVSHCSTVYAALGVRIKGTGFDGFGYKLPLNP